MTESQSSTRRLVTVLMSAVMVLSVIGIGGAGLAGAQETDVQPTYELQFDGNSDTPYAFGVPGPTDQTFGQFFGDNATAEQPDAAGDGVIYRYTGDGWEQVTTDTEINGLEGYVLTDTAQQITATAAIAQDENQFQTASLALDSGANFVTPTAQGDVSDALTFQISDGDATQVQNPYAEPSVSPGTETPFSSVGVATGGEKVNPFAGYFLISDSGQYTSTINTGNNQAAANDGLNLDAAPAPANFAVTNVSPQDDNVTEGEPLAVEITVENTGGVGDTKNVGLGVNTDDLPENYSDDPTSEFESVNGTALTLGSSAEQTVTLTYESAIGDAPEIDVFGGTEDDFAIERATLDAAPGPQFESATVEDGSPSEIVVGFDEDVNVTGGDTAYANDFFTFDPEENLTNSPGVAGELLTAEDGNVIVPLNGAIDASDNDTLTNALTYDDTSETVVAQSDARPAEEFSNESVANNVVADVTELDSFNASVSPQDQPVTQGDSLNVFFSDASGSNSNTFTGNNVTVSVNTSTLDGYDSGPDTVTVDFDDGGATSVVTLLDGNATENINAQEATLTATVSGDVATDNETTTTFDLTVTGADDGGDTTAPTISSFSVDNTDGQTVEVSFNSDEVLEGITVNGTDDASGTTLTETNFSETGNATDGFTYTATLSENADGTFGATLETAADTAGNDGADDQSDTVTVDTVVETTSLTVDSATFTDDSPSDSVTIFGTVTSAADETLSSITVGFGNIGLGNVEADNIDIGNAGAGNVAIGNSGTVDVGNVEVGNSGDDLTVNLNEDIALGNVGDGATLDISIDDVDTTDATTDGTVSVSFEDTTGDTITENTTNDIQLTAAPASVGGTVTDSTGSEVSEGTLNLYSGTDTSADSVETADLSQSATYDFTGLDAGTYTLEVTGVTDQQDFTSEIELTAGEDATNDIQLTAAPTTSLTVDSATFDDGDSQSDSVTILGSVTSAADETLSSVTVGFGNIAGNIGLGNVEAGNIDIGNAGAGNVKIGNSGTVDVGNVEVGNSGDDLTVNLNEDIALENVDDDTEVNVSIDDIDTTEADTTTDGTVSVSFEDTNGDTITENTTDNIQPTEVDTTVEMANNPVTATADGSDITVTVTANEELAPAKIAVANVDGESAGSFSEVGTTGASPYEYEATISGVADGDYSVDVTNVEDAAGNTLDPTETGTADVTVDTTVETTSLTVDSATFDDGNSQSDSVTILGSVTSAADETLSSITVGFGNIAGNIGLGNVEAGNVEIGNAGAGNAAIGNVGNVGIGNVQVGNNGNDLEINLNEGIDLGNVDGEANADITIDDVDTTEADTTDGNVTVSFEDTNGDTITEDDTEASNNQE